MRETQMLQAELEAMKNQNAGLAQEHAKINSDISETVNIVHEKETEVQKIRLNIERSQDDGRFIKGQIDDLKY